MKETLEVFDHVRLNFSPSRLLTLNITITFIIFSIAPNIKPEHFSDVEMKPKSVLRMILITFWWGVWHIISGLPFSTLWLKKGVPQTA